jgi:hypothetical protein
MNEIAAIVRFSHFCETEVSKSPYIGRITGLINPENFVKLMRVMTVDSNPRSPKESAVTREIVDTLRTNPGLFHLMSKGLLLSVTACKPLERNRQKLSFDPNPYATPGILDGGHNTFAIAKYLLSLVLTETELKAVKDWASLIPVWREYEDVIEDLVGSGESQGGDVSGFLVPIEVIYPRNPDRVEEMKLWGESHRDITHARNNNVQLTDSTQDHHQGFYEYLKSVLPEQVREKVEWKTNAGGTIKAADVVALALIPLSKLPKSETGVEITLQNIYRFKQYCVETYRQILEYDSNGIWHGQTYSLTNERVQAALQLVPDVLRAYDYIYKKFPNWYNSAEGSFGRIGGVRIFDPNGDKNNPKKYSKKPFSTKFFEEDCAYQYADGFILPLVVGLRSLIDPETMTWTTDPIKFLEKNSVKVVAMYSTIIKFAQWDPQRLGKDKGSYEIVQGAIAMAMSAN